METFKHFIYRAIRNLVTLLLSLSLFVSFQSDILYLDKLSNKFIVLLLLFIFLIYIWLLVPKSKRKKILLQISLFMKQNQKIIFWSFFILSLIYQIFLLFTLKSMPHYDSGLLLNRLTDKKAAVAYLSINSNNLFLYFFNYFLSLFIGTDMFRFQILNSIFIFIAVLLFKELVTKLFNNPTLGYISASLFIFYSIIQPLYLVPYTDTYCLIPMFLSNIFMLKIFNNRNLKMNYFDIFLSAIFCSISYLIRPSSIVFIIAIFFFLLLNLDTKKIRQKFLKFFPMYLIGIFTIIFSFNLFVEKQTVLNLDLSKEVPMTHFLLLGSSGDEDKKEAVHGTWNAEDIKTTHSGNSTAEKSRLALNAFVNRTKKRGFSKTIKLYMQKYIQNTDAGVVGYHRDGLWIKSIYSPKGTFKNKVQQIYNEDGYLRPTFNFLCQIVWIITLMFAIIGTWNRKDWIISLVSLTVFGGLLFLLIFESGGTKYLFQYLPWIIILSSVGIDLSLKKITNKKSKKAISET